jgi:hypothetical protein
LVHLAVDAKMILLESGIAIPPSELANHPCVPTVRQPEPQNALHGVAGVAAHHSHLLVW